MSRSLGLRRTGLPTAEFLPGIHWQVKNGTIKPALPAGFLFHDDWEITLHRIAIPLIPL